LTLPLNLCRLARLCAALAVAASLGSVPAGAQSPSPDAAPPPVDASVPPPTTEPAPVSDTVGQVGRAGFAAGKKKRGKGDLILAPVPFSNPTIETGLALGVSYIFYPDKNDTVSPPSSAMLGGLGSTNGTKGGFLAGKFFLKEDQYRVSGGYAQIDARYDFYGIGNDLAD